MGGRGVPALTVGVAAAFPWPSGRTVKPGARRGRGFRVSTAGSEEVST
jgi:hypothetical protein